MSMKPSQTKSIKADSGFTLIEVMVALSILAIGLLGMTALQTEALRFNHSALIDSQAQYLLTDIAERIRANRGNDLYQISFTEQPPTVSVDCESQSCSSNEMATWDLNQWRNKVEDDSYMPDGESAILFDNLTRTFVISIRYEWGRLGGVDVTDGKRTLTMTTRI